jgi:hypothetical protein
MKFEKIAEIILGRKSTKNVSIFAQIGSSFHEFYKKFFKHL